LLGSRTLPAASQLAEFDSRLESLRSLIELGQYAQAEVEAERFFNLVSETPGTAKASLAAADLLVEALTRNGRGAEPRTREIAERVVQSKLDGSGPDDASLAVSLRNLGEVLFQAGEYTLSVTQFEEALRVSERSGGNQTQVAEMLDHLARALTRIERYDEALSASEQAWAIKQQMYSSVDIALARTLEIRGMIWHRKIDFGRARSDFEVALAIREATNRQHPDTAFTLMQLGLQRRYEGDLVQSRLLLNRAVSLAESSLRPDHPSIATYLRFQAWPLQDLGDLAGARRLQERGLAIADRSLGSDHPEVADHLNDLANTLLQLGEYPSARLLFDRALKIHERRLGPDHFDVTTVVYNLAVVNAMLGDSQEARRLLRRALNTWERTHGVEHPAVSAALYEFAQMLSRDGDDRQAQPFFERALTIRERVLGPNHTYVAKTLSSMSLSLSRLGQINRASGLSTRALQIWERAETPETGGFAEALVVDASVQTGLGNYDFAKQEYERALQIQLPILGPSHPGIAEIDIAQAAALAHLGRTTEAFAKAREGEQIGRDHLRLTLGYLPERQALGYAAKRPKGLDLALSLASDADSRAQALDAVIRGRALILDELGFRRRSVADPAASTLAPLWISLTSARQRLANLVIRGPSEQRPEQYAGLVDEARREAEKAERALAEKSATFRAELERSEVGLSEVRAALGQSTALVSFARYDRTIIDRRSAMTTATTPAAATVLPPRKPVPSYIAFVLRASDSDVSVVPLGPARVIDALVARWQAETTGAVNAASPADAEISYRTAGAALRRRVWDPISKHLAGATTALVVPDGQLNLVSLAALPIGETKYLIDDGPVIHYLSAERDLVSNPSPAAANRGLLAVGGAAFDDTSSFARVRRPSASRVAANSASVPAGSSSASFRSAPSERLQAACGTFDSLRFTALVGTRREVRDIASLWTDSPAQILESQGASERSFKREAPGHRVLHLATHGFFLGSCSTATAGTRSIGGLATRPKIGPKLDLGESPLLLSGLAFAGANRRAAAGPDEDDGLLTAEEVSALNLEGVEWAVLSACDTGLGEVKAGEGVFGLRRAFQVAGVRTVIMSLWPVDDQATRIWMRALYQGRLQKKLSTADAMHQASLTVLRNRRANHQSTHPFYWAAFVAAGDWR
jgi:CHAT domain-containing protein/Tfp pilus assembly protein PilF